MDRTKLRIVSNDEHYEETHSALDATSNFEAMIEKLTPEACIALNRVLENEKKRVLIKASMMSRSLDSTSKIHIQEASVPANIIQLSIIPKIGIAIIGAVLSYLGASFHRGTTSPLELVILVLMMGLGVWMSNKT